MFKKPFDGLKTSAPLKNSDRRKLRQRVLQDFLGFDAAVVAECSEVGDLLVPDGMQSVKFTTHSGELGLAYLSADGEPLWFTLGKGSNDLIPTVYTLWKRPRLLPFVSTPSAVIPVLQNGADLMAAGVVEMSGSPSEDQLVAVTCYTPGAIGPPLAVGRMAKAGSHVREGDARGKAVHVLHIFKDKLWEMGRRGDPPQPVLVVEGEDERITLDDGGLEETEKKAEHAEVTPLPPSEAGETKEDAEPPSLDPQGVSTILHAALLQAILTTLSALPPGSFPLLSTHLYTQHILPARPAYLSSISSFTASSATPIDIKHSAHKGLSAFLRGAEKEGLLRLKEARGRGGGDVQVLSVNAGHSDVQAHRRYRTIAEVEAEREKKEERDAKQAARPREIVVTELWKPHQQSIRFFEEIEKDSTALYTQQEIKETISAYITAKSLVNTHQQQFINIDDLLHDVLATKGSDVPEFMKRDVLTQRLIKRMQPWHRIEVDGKDSILKKGKLQPVSVTIKLRQGRKACTLVTGFEEYQLDAAALAEELRRGCASSTAVASLPGKGAGLEVMVQGKQLKAVRELLMAKGIPKAWIEESDLTTVKKK